MLSPAQKHLLEKDLLVPSEVSKLLRVSVATVHRWTNGGKMKCVFLPGNQRHAKRIPSEEVVSLLEHGDTIE